MLEKTGRRWLRVIHIVFIASLLGGLISILVINHLSGMKAHQIFVANLTIYRLFNTIITVSFYGVVSTGLVYSVFTHWGLTKYWWIIGKWVGTLSLFALVWIWLGPAANGMVALSDVGLPNFDALPEYVNFKNSLDSVILVAFTIMCCLIAITIFRPWGQREQRYELKRATILLLTGFGVIVSVGFGVLGYLDLEKYRNLEITEPDLSKISDGTYQGAETYAGFTYAIECEVMDHTITQVRIVENRDSPYARYAEGIVSRILDNQSPNVDGITGATTTSKCFMKALESALQGAN